MGNRRRRIGPLCGAGDPHPKPKLQLFIPGSPSVMQEGALVCRGRNLARSTVHLSIPEGRREEKLFAGYARAGDLDRYINK